MADDIQINPADSGQTGGTGTTGSSQPAGGGSAQSAQTGTTPTTTGQKPPTNISLLEETDMIAAVSDASQNKRTVPDLVTQKFPDLVKLIEETESMNNDERDYWFQILPIMTEDQIGKFRDILLNEKMQLNKLDKEYENKLEKLNEKHMIEWKEFETKEKRRAIAGAEMKSQEEEKQKEEELLARLAEL